MSNPRGRRLAAAALLAFALAPSRARACDLCSIYTGSLMQQEKTGFALAVAEQYGDFASIRQDGHSRSNPANERIDSSITQLVVAYSFLSWLGIQADAPLVSRDYRRIEDGTPTHGSVGGLGDISLLARVSPYSHAFGDTLVHMELLAGIKLPTGDTHRLFEELSEPPGGNPSTVHGHDLALGTGSVDGLFGASAHVSWKRLFGDAALQYAVRSRGDAAYQYANDLTWEAAPGLYLLLEHTYTAALRVVASGEYKSRDHQGGELQDDTAITSVYLGPGVQMTWSDSLHVDLTVDVPVVEDVTGRQLVPNYRLRGGVVWRF
ncbi:MAG TPA: hypothetical protein VGK20_16850 [Candidatus Binatia bacterium]|jgi:hypothetical protein